MSSTLPTAALPDSPMLPPRLTSSAFSNLSRPITTITTAEISCAKRCGGGGFGDVYLLRHPLMGKLALKRVRTSGDQKQIDDQIRRSVREAETWRRLSHPNVLPFLDVLERSGDTYLVSPFVNNGSISDFLKRHPEADRPRLLRGTAGGIAYLHRSGIIHGDIKAANILVSDDFRALLCDFGLAREQQANTSTDMQGIGTVRWQSPELLLYGKGKTFKSDVWAFGMTIYEVLSGNVPFHQHSSAPPVMYAIVYRQQRPPTEPGHSPTGASYATLWAVAGQCWHEDPDQRPEMQEAHDELNLTGFDSLSISSSSGDALDVFLGVGRAGGSQRTDGSGSTRSSITVTAGDDEDETMDAQSGSTWDGDTPTIDQMEQDKLISRPNDKIFENHSGWVAAFLAFSPDGKTIVSAADDFTIRLWDMESGNQKCEGMKGHAHHISCLAFSLDGTVIVSGSQDRTVRVWHAGSGRPIGKPLKGHRKSVDSVAFLPDGKTIVSGSEDTVRLWDLDSQSQKAIVIHPNTNYFACLGISQDGRTVVSEYSDHSIRLWDVESQSPRGEGLHGDIESIVGVVFSPDGRMIASRSMDQTIRLWDVESGSQAEAILEGHEDMVSCLVFSPDGRTIASGSEDCTIRLWDVESATQRGEALEGHLGWVRCLAFCPSGRTVVSGSNDATVRFWDTGSI